MINNKPPITCPQCGSKIRYITAGISKKSGKPYNEFWACSNRECNFTWRPIIEKKIISTSEGEIIEALRKIWVKLDEIKKVLEKSEAVYYPKSEE